MRETCKPMFVRMRILKRMRVLFCRVLSYCLRATTLTKLHENIEKAE
jgi:hypothetical protein